MSRMLAAVLLLAGFGVVLAQTPLRPNERPAPPRINPQDKEALWGAYNYTADKDVARVSMKLEKLPFDLDQLTWAFLDMKNDGGRIALMWGTTLASTPFKAMAAK